MLLKVAFPAFIPGDRDELEAKLMLWQRMFERTGYKEAEWAAERCIESCTFPPTVADMKQYLGMARTLDDVRAALPMKIQEPQYPSDITIAAGYERAMRAISQAQAFKGNQPVTAKE